MNLAYQITNGSPTFDPNNDTVEIRGDFNNNNWSSGFPLVRVGNTTSYTNTYDLTSPSPSGVVKFKYHTYGPLEDNWENLQGYIYTNGYGNRAFVLLPGPAQTLTPVYFSDQWGGIGPLAQRDGHAAHERVYHGHQVTTMAIPTLRRLGPGRRPRPSSR